MNFNTKKCKLLPITRKRSSISAPLLLDGTPLEAATEISDLGLLTDYKLSYNSRKTNVVLGLHRRNCRDLRDISTLRTLYYALAIYRRRTTSPEWPPVSISGYFKQLSQVTSGFLKLMERRWKAKSWGVCFNPLTPISDQDRISPYNIHTT